MKREVGVTRRAPPFLLPLATTALPPRSILPLGRMTTIAETRIKRRKGTATTRSGRRRRSAGSAVPPRRNHPQHAAMRGTRTRTRESTAPKRRRSTATAAKTAAVMMKETRVNVVVVVVVLLQETKRRRRNGLVIAHGHALVPPRLHLHLLLPAATSPAHLLGAPTRARVHAHAPQHLATRVKNPPKTSVILLQREEEQQQEEEAKEAREVEMGRMPARGRALAPPRCLTRPSLLGWRMLLATPISMSALCGTKSTSLWRRRAKRVPR